MRHTDWQSRLTDYMQSVHGKPFEEGVFDCAIMPADAVEAMTGHDFAERWRGYADIEDGIAQLQDAGYDDHADLASSLFPVCSPAHANVGDLMVMRAPSTPYPIMGIVQGPKVWVVTLSGLGLWPRHRGLRAFRV